ncbi:NUDIX hydrolase [Geodermatophilus sabuli]|uniref:8-oxo-dGTP pyrophosphatase MutT, NUDIX family n=1 Tax=Geodermatophilus sabuli TaxID=1564158 RepID=A0A285EJ10_9ACTN|nr:NUDIX domain-containing protein [Geodermatophilus sabuli]MBB3085802.1 8-oxo-dGTP pyrophosphatase MutT (NUDIX family) [Geodermatophilus sabuli]SNX98987.1 8-oxo-dGTP pyrophosphatase MutT, NUDIX family [Geodermatophilus sabuli]
MSDRPWVRPTARAVVLDPAGRVLLLGARLTDPAVPPGDVLFWYTPGGGVEDGESVRGAAVRELAEEIGLVVEPGDLEGPVWFRRHVGPFAGVQIDSRETFFVLRDVVHDVDPSGRTELELLGEEPHRWWTAEEVAASPVPMAPRELATLLPELLEGPWTGPPRFVA